MDPLKLLFGLFCVSIAAVALRYPEADFRLRGLDARQIDADDHPRAIRRNKTVAWVVLVLGLVLVVFGLLG